MDMGCGLGESGQDIQNRIITRRKGMHDIPMNGPLRPLFARIVERVIDIIFGPVMGTGRQLEYPKELFI